VVAVWERYHLSLALWSALAGCAAAVVDRLAEPPAAPAGRPVHPLRRWAWPLAVASMVGVWASVPDTEAPLALGAALAPVAAGRWWRHRAPTPSATLVVVGAVVLAAVGGSAGWPGAVMTWTAVGAVLVAPVRCGFPGSSPFDHRGRALVATVHLVVAVGGARLLTRLAAPAAVALGVTYLVVVAAAVEVALRRSRR
jgi:hypothetical protein